MTVATPRSGFDLEYYLNRTAGEKTGGGYYLNAAQQGEPDGRWFGKGAEALGLRDGQVVRKEPYLAVYTDITIAHNKSVSVLHASFREQARRALLSIGVARLEAGHATQNRVICH